MDPVNMKNFDFGLCKNILFCIFVVVLAKCYIFVRAKFKINIFIRTKIKTFYNFRDYCNIKKEKNGLKNFSTFTKNDKLFACNV
jgi:hypothetical protein